MSARRHLSILFFSRFKWTQPRNINWSLDNESYFFGTQPLTKRFIFFLVRGQRPPFQVKQQYALKHIHLKFRFIFYFDLCFLLAFEQLKQGSRSVRVSVLTFFFSVAAPKALKNTTLLLMSLMFKIHCYFETWKNWRCTVCIS